MRNYQYYLHIIWKYKWLLMTIIIVCLLSTYIYFSKQTPLYESRAEIYPLVMYKNVHMLSLNPCYQIDRIAHAEQFHRLMIASNVSPTLTLENYNKRIACHETPRHTLAISAKAEKVAWADSLLWQFLNQLDFAGKHLTSLQMVVDTCSLAPLIPWDYYNKHVDFLDQDSAKCYTEGNGMFFLFDVISEPYCEKEPVYPPDMLKMSVIVFLISAFLSIVGVCLMEEIRQRWYENKTNNTKHATTIESV